LTKQKRWITVSSLTPGFTVTSHLAFLCLLVACSSTADRNQPVQGTGSAAKREGLRIVYDIDLLAASEGHPAEEAKARERAALDLAVVTIRTRLAALRYDGATVKAEGETIVVELPAASNDRIWRAKSVIARTGKLDFAAVDDGSPYMKRLYAEVDAAKPEGIQADIDHWRPDDAAALHTDFYLVAADREQQVSVAVAKQLGCFNENKVHGDSVSCLISGRHVIDRYLRELTQRDPSFKVPDDRRIGYEAMPNPAGRPTWRSYFLERGAALSGTLVANATVAIDPNTQYASVLLDFNADGTRVFADLTTRLVGRKLAIIFDGVVRSAPIINEPILGGRASIAMGIASDKAAEEQQANDLALVLKSGSLPAPLRESSVSLIE
jgi:protein-export membrane protein SecD